MYCPECGKFNPDENLACQYCGVSLQTPPTDNGYYSGENYDPNYQGSNYDPNYQGNNYDPNYQGYDYGQNYPENIDGSSPGDTTDDLLGDAFDKIKSYDYSKVKDGLLKALEFIKEHKKISIPVSIVLVVFIVFLAIGSSVTSPERIAKKYFQAFVDCDYAEMYDYVAVLDSDFITADSFAKYMENYQGSSSNQFQNIGKFTIEKVRFPGSGKHTKEYYAEFYDSLTGNSDTFPIVLVKQEKNALLFFDNYKVTLGENILTQNAKLAIPSGFEATIDGVKLTEKDTSSEDNNGHDVYVISAILNGTHEVVLKSEMFEDFTTDVSFYGEYDEYETVGNLGDMTIKADIASTLQKRAAADLQSLYTSALAGADVSTLKVAVSPDFDDFADCYSNICKRIVGYQEGTGLKSFNITKSSIRPSSYGNKTGISISSSDLGVTASFTLEYDYNFSKAVQNYGSPDLTIENGTRDYDTTFRYVLIDGEWKLNYISSYNISY